MLIYVMRWPPSWISDQHKNPNFVEDVPIIIPGHLGFPIGIKSRYFVEDLSMIIPGQFGFNCPSGFREEAF
jgi:hypothetical protein